MTKLNKEEIKTYKYIRKKRIPINPQDLLHLQLLDRFILKQTPYPYMFVEKKRIIKKDYKGCYWKQVDDYSEIKKTDILLCLEIRQRAIYRRLIFKYLHNSGKLKVFINFEGFKIYAERQIICDSILYILKKRC